MTWGSSTVYSKTETLIGNNQWTPVLGSIATLPQYNMFGLDIGTYNTNPITITVFTDSGSYVLPSQTMANSAAGQLEFIGFIASGEYFTGFDISADNGSGNLAGITHVQVGNTVVPEPASLALLSFGIISAGIFGRRRQSSTTPIAGQARTIGSAPTEAASRNGCRRSIAANGQLIDYASRACRLAWKNRHPSESWLMGAAGTGLY